MASARGKFITFEGLDGCGKSTQLQKLASVLRRQGIEVLATREPGGTAIGEKVREVLLSSRTSNLAPLAELALMFASRAQHLYELIQPALQAGTWVLCDRYSDSSVAYQGAGRQLGVDTVLSIHRAVCRDIWPDLTVLMDSDPAASVKRARRRNTARGGAVRVDENRFEQENRAFFVRVHDEYLAIARREPGRVVMVDARRPIAAVHRDIVAAVRARLVGETTR